MYTDWYSCDLMHVLKPVQSKIKFQSMYFHWMEKTDIKCMSQLSLLCAKMICTTSKAFSNDILSDSDHLQQIKTL